MVTKYKIHSNFYSLYKNKYRSDKIFLPQWNPDADRGRSCALQIFLYFFAGYLKRVKRCGQMFAQEPAVIAGCYNQLGYPFCGINDNSPRLRARAIVILCC